MHFPKVYGQSQNRSCPFCGKSALAMNCQNVPVCSAHKESELVDLKCICGGWLDLLSGKWGPYFHCLNCGNVTFRKGLEINPQVRKSDVPTFVKNPSPAKTIPSEKKETTITSDELDLM